MAHLIGSKVFNKFNEVGICYNSQCKIKDKNEKKNFEKNK